MSSDHWLAMFVMEDVSSSVFWSYGTSANARTRRWAWLIFQQINTSFIWSWNKFLARKHSVLHRADVGQCLDSVVWPILKFAVLGCFLGKGLNKLQSCNWNELFCLLLKHSLTPCALNEDFCSRNKYWVWHELENCFVLQCVCYLHHMQRWALRYVGSRQVEDARSQ